jgi:hypothetical protein
LTPSFPSNGYEQKRGEEREPSLTISPSLSERWLCTGEESYMRENLAAFFLRATGVPASLVFHLQLRQNSQFYGLYSFVEQVDHQFLERNGYDPKVKAPSNPTSTSCNAGGQNTNAVRHHCDGRSTY